MADRWSRRLLDQRESALELTRQTLLIAAQYGISETLPSNHKQWIIPFAVQLIPGGMLALGAIWLRESPRWLFSKGKREQGLKNLLWIRNLPADNFYIVEEISFIEAALEHQKSTVGLGFFDPFKAVFKSRSLQWRVFLGTTLFIFQNGSGINAINYYSPTVFKSLGIVGGNTSFLTTGLFGVVKTIFTLIWLFFLIDKFGRRNLLLVGAVGGAVCMLILGGYLASPLVDTSSAATAVAKPLSSGGIAAVFFFYLWTAFYTPSWNGTPWVINSEMYEQNVRSLGQAMAAASNWFWVSFSKFMANIQSCANSEPEFHYCQIHRSNVCEHGQVRMWCLLLLCWHDVAFSPLCVVHDSRNQVRSSRVDEQTLRDQTLQQGQRHCHARGAGSRSRVPRGCRRCWPESREEQGCPCRRQCCLGDNDILKTSRLLNVYNDLNAFFIFNRELISDCSLFPSSILYSKRRS